MFDFGFTAVDEEELESVRELKTSVKTSGEVAHETEERLNSLYNAILPLLSNLKANPEKDYIYWPNRTKKVEEFEDIIAKIIQ
jgi:uncharacterized protein involved in tolerance to divalent cations